MPFSLGPRNCVGQNLAMFEIKLVLVNLLRKFKLTIDSSHEITKDFFLTLRPRNAYLIPVTVAD